MAREVIERLVDDLDGSDADAAVKFGLDGRAYSIDLTDKNADELRAVLAPYVSVATLERDPLRVTRRRMPVQQRQAAGSAQVSALRQWARDNGYEVSDRGRISKEIRAAYEQTVGVAS